MNALRLELYLFFAFVTVLLLDLFYPASWEDRGLSKAKALGWMTAILIAVGAFLGSSLFAVPGVAFGGALVKTHLSVIFAELFLFSGLLTVLCSIDRVSGNTTFPWARFSGAGEFYCLILLSLLGMCLIPLSRELLTLYLALELATIPLFLLSGFAFWDRLSSEGAAKYLVNGIFASAIMLFGLSFIYGAMAGDTFFASQGLPFSALSLLGLIFLLAGLLFKVTAVPFHFWAPDVYQGAPTSITAFLSLGSKAAGLAFLTVIFHSLFADFNEIIVPVFVVLSVATMTLGNLGAMKQSNMKRFLAYSSVSQAGYIFLAFLDSSPLGLTSLLFYIFVYIGGNIAAFSVLTYVENESGSVEMDAFSGMHRSHPLLALIMLLALFSLAGIPPLAGFFGKFWLFAAAAHAGFYWLVVVAALNSIISLYYYLGVIRRMYILERDSSLPALPESPLSPALRWSMGLSTVAMAGFIFYPGIIDVIDKAVRAFIG